VVARGVVAVKYIHTNLTVRDLAALSKFYQDIFGCVPVREPLDLSGSAVSGITNVERAAIRYVHLTLPGFGPGGPELELIQYENETIEPVKASNCLGYGHLAFSVADVRETLDRIIAAGGSAVGELVTADIPNRGRLTEVYAADPEGNIIELQHYA
jgi:catechol 2,3-dioxygenase-like lactoylglutathione lyase family enzyme